MESGRCLKHAYAISIGVLLHISASLSLFHHHASATRCVEREREALLAIKQDLVDKHDLLSSWGSGREVQKQDCCRWEGVYCDNQTGHVLRLDLGADRWQDDEFTFSRLEGKISPNLIRLHHLTYLDLSYNDFNGSQIPPFIGCLTNLRYLDLSWARFGGQIPSHALGNLTHLQYLNLGGNDFSHSVENLNWLHHLSSLKYLDLSGTNLSNVFDWLEKVNKLPNLRNLTLNFCDLPPILSISFSYINSSKSLASVDLSFNNVTSSIFKWLCNYNTLVNLDLSFNQLSGSLPNIFGNMSSLTHLDLSGNQLTSLTPDSFRNMRSLTYLRLYNNQLTGSLPDVFGNMSSLTELSLSDNQLEGGIPNSFAKLCGLQYLYLSSNNLSGHISNFFELSCAQNSLQNLYVSKNNLAGPFPDLTNFVALNALILEGNQLTGTIPESIGQMSNLENILVSNNHLEGVISETHFSQLSSFRYLDLSSNSLVLDFHSEWVPPFQLTFLYLDSCKMGPLFPKWLRTQKNLQSLSISDAGISDIIPSWFWDWSKNITEMDLSRNEIKGRLADSEFELPYEPERNLSWNQLEGPIPSFLSKAASLDLSNNKLSKVDSFLCATNVSHLKFLDLSSNQVSGVLPDCWKHFEDLVFLDLGNNILSGNIPTTMGSLSSIETLKLDNNRLEGELPSSSKNWTSLVLLGLAENKLSGLIPKWLGVGIFPNLTILILRSNHFNGSMPSQLCHLTSIQVLDLSMNNISGSIPKCLNNLTTIAEKGNPHLTINHKYTIEGRDDAVLDKGSYDDEISIIWKGRLSKYKSILGLVKSIDLSSNILAGDIPNEITDLVGLVSLNLAGNYLSGQIPPEIGKLKSLDSLDLSRNQIAGGIPTSLAQIDRLGYLNLSYNNLSGEIPTGTQLQGRDPSFYAGNYQLCGLPLERICDSEGTGRPNVSNNQEDPDELIMQGFYISLGFGFAVGFWGVCGSLIFKRSWRYAYYKFLNASNDWLYLKVALIKRKLRDVFYR